MQWNSLHVSFLMQMNILTSAFHIESKIHSHQNTVFIHVQVLASAYALALKSPRNVSFAQVPINTP